MDEKMTLKNSFSPRQIIGAKVYGPREKLFRDAAPSGSTVGGTGEESTGYREYNQTNRPIGGTEARRSDGAIRDVLACWGADRETQIVEESGLKYLIMWSRLQPGEGNPVGATTADPIRKSATTMNDPEKSFADPPVGPRTMLDARIANTFARLRSHNEKPTPQAKRALTNIRKNADALGSINDANRDFWGKK
jgi:hypothetical protein